MGVMVLTLMVGWLVVSVLFAVLWSLVIRGGRARDSHRYDVPDYVVGTTGLPAGPSPRRSREGMAESSW